MATAYEVKEHSITCSEAKGMNPEGTEETKRHWYKGSLVELSAEDAKSLLACKAVKAPESKPETPAKK